MILTLALAAAATPQLAAPLAPMAPLVGHCWTAEVAAGQRDTHCFEAMYDGHFVRDRHEVSGRGVSYKGETVYAVEGTPARVAYTYWSSDGETMRGTMRGDGKRLDFGETVTRDAAGHEVRFGVEWALADGSYDARWISPDPRYSRSMHYVRNDPAPGK